MNEISIEEEIVLGVVFYVLYLALGLAQIVAFMEGLEVWFELGTLASIGAFFLAMMLPGLGAIAISVVGFYGATNGWGWDWWQAGLLCFPFPIIAVVGMIAQAVEDRRRFR